MRKCFLHGSAFVSALMILLFASGNSFSAPTAAHRAFSFSVFGDNQPQRADLSQSQIFKSILDDIEGSHPDFAVSVGDTICGSSDLQRVRVMYQDYADTCSSHLKAKLYQAVGNHDIYGSKGNQWFFRSKMGDLYYSWDLEGSHFIVLDSEVVGEEGRIAGEQLRWLKSDLYKARGAQHKFIFVHRPLFPVDGHFGSSLDVNKIERDGLHKLFATYHVTAVFSGHEHLFNLETRSGVRYFITGGAGGSLFPSFFGTGDFHHYVSVNVDGAKVKYLLVKADGERFTHSAIK